MMQSLMKLIILFIIILNFTQNFCQDINDDIIFYSIASVGYKNVGGRFGYGKELEPNTSFQIGLGITNLLKYFESAVSLSTISMQNKWEPPNYIQYDLSGTYIDFEVKLKAELSSNANLYVGCGLNLASYKAKEELFWASGVVEFSRNSDSKEFLNLFLSLQFDLALFNRLSLFSKASYYLNNDIKLEMPEALENGSGFSASISSFEIDDYRLDVGLKYYFAN